MHPNSTTRPVGVKGDDHHPSPAWRNNARVVGDIRRPYLVACDEWDAASRLHYATSMAVAGGTGTTADLAAAKQSEAEALGRVLAARADIAELLTAMLRAAMADECVRHSLMLSVIGLLRPALEPVAERLAATEARLDDLELLLASSQGGG